MIFDLFGKKSKAAEGHARNCICQPTKVALIECPFEEVARLTGSYDHENASLARCKACGGAALYYSADVYDDFWQYWCRIDEAERAELQESDEARKRCLLLGWRVVSGGSTHCFSYCHGHRSRSSQMTATSWQRAQDTYSGRTRRDR